jgi:hypothetical protein
MVTVGGLIAAICMLVAPVSLGPHRSDLPSPEVMSAARLGLARFVAGIPAGEKAMYGLDDCGDLAAAKLDEPLRLYTVAVDKALAAQPETDPLDVISPTENWAIPVQCGGATGSFLTVDKTPNGYEAVDFGGTVHASELLAVQREWPRNLGYSYRLVRDPALRAAFVVVLKSEEATSAFGVVSLQATAEDEGQLQRGNWQPQFKLFGDIVRPIQETILERHVKGDNAYVH